MPKIARIFQNQITEAIIRVADDESASQLQAVLQAHPDWRPLEAAAPTPAPTTAPTSIASPPPFVAPPVQPAPQERRVHSRHNVKFRVIITSGNVSFQTYSTDVSGGGMKLQRKLPAALVNQPCMVFISNTDGTEKIQISCHILADSAPNSTRVQFTECEGTLLNQVQSWIKRAA